VTCLTLAILLLLRLTKIYHIIGFSILVIFITANIMMLVSSNEKIRNITSIAPNFKNVLSIKEYTTFNETIYYRSHFGILARPHDRFPHRTRGEFKIEWLADDIAAVTYRATDDSIQQYIATYGDRGGGSSYYYVGAEIQGRWQNGNMMLLSLPEGIYVSTNDKLDFFDWDNIHQFGTLAIVLTRDDQALWTVSLDENFEVHSDAAKPTVGNISLYKATMEDNQPIVLQYQGLE